MNVLRYARPLKDIVSRNPHSILQKFANGELSQASSYRSDAYWTYLPLAPHNYLIDEEGRESEKILRGHLENRLGSLKNDEKILLNKDDTINFKSKANLEYIATKYSYEYKLSVQESLGKPGLHKLTHLYSFAGEVESDHTIPHRVWKLTDNQKMKDVVAAGTGKRLGAGDMPAITIPYGIHQKKLRTTGGVTGWKDFHKSLITLCNGGKIDKALVMCYNEYQDKGITLADYETSIKNSLSQYVDLGLISTEQRQQIIERYF